MVSKFYISISIHFGIFFLFQLAPVVVDICLYFKNDVRTILSYKNVAK